MKLILGCGNFGGIGSAPQFFGQGESEEEAYRLMDAAWERGIRSFDTADAYGGGRSETWIGRWLERTGNEPVLTTKVFHSVEGDPGTTASRASASCGRSTAASCGSASITSTCT